MLIFHVGLPAVKEGTFIGRLALGVPPTPSVEGTSRFIISTYELFTRC